MDSFSHLLHANTEYNVSAGSHIFGTVSAEIDPLGNVTRYFYDDTNGRLLAITYPEGNGVCYDYDGMGNLIEVLPASLSANAGSYSEITNSASVNYTYDAVTNRLSSISTESTTYTFSYDTFGNSTEISAGNHELVSYTYYPNNGKLETLTYGNGLIVKYFYDALDRIVKIDYNIGEGGAFETVYSYKYAALGYLESVQDHVNRTSEHYVYNATGNLLQTVLYDEETQAVSLLSNATYDEQGRVVTEDHTIYSQNGTSDGIRLSSEYLYDTSSGRLIDAQIGPNDVSGFWDKFEYDFFGRLKKTTSYIYLLDPNLPQANHSLKNVVQYNYVESANGDQSGLVSVYSASLTQSDLKDSELALYSAF